VKDPCHPLLPLLRTLGREARAVVSRVLREVSVEERSREGAHSGSDVIYAIDREVEERLLECLGETAEGLGGIVLVAEGIGEEEVTVHPGHWREADCRWRMLVDPIDGTRPIMMDKRSAWFLAGVAPNRGGATRLREIECAVMAELPTSRAAVADDFYAVRGQGAAAERVELIREGIPPKRWVPNPWAGPTIRGGFVQMVRFCPPGRDEIAAVEEAMMARLFPEARGGEILSFEDQYPCTGGQLVELMCGRDRFNADVRGVLYGSERYVARRIGHVCHPYDLAGALVAEEAGVILTTAAGAPFDGPFDTGTAMSWIGYPNAAIRAEVEGVLLELIRECWG
jgi:fructose-1,6-bisphosphatase/inositol monophosphatase family enzyme